ncbi:alpha/beta hydrolase-fold protein [Necropsobacter massiliensis]|uniref:alpha/beta hydrolase-fold protein n=1 Tax=Necropsobacter massiliensis TaxID=1400001 RepID=UPI00059626A8|nr:alpha/beta hydrolase-fold protein [Necropsobacter massiliensis]
MKKYLFILCVFLLPFSHIAGAGDQPQSPKSLPNVTLLAEITAKGQKINAVALEYEDNIFSGSDLTLLYQVETQLDQQTPEKRTIQRAYVNDSPQLSHQSKPGKFVIIELDIRDKNAALYSLRKENTQPMIFRSKKNGKVTTVEKIQANSVPDYYNARLIYHISQQGNLKLTNGKTLSRMDIKQSAVQNQIKTAYLDQFESDQISLHTPANHLYYRLYRPHSVNGKKYPLTIFLHGSGQVGKDNLAHLLSSKGAISTLQYEDGFVLAPQYDSVFDPFDDVNKGQRGGIHWQTENRQQLLLRLIDSTLAQYPTIDPARIYLVGLSRGAEGALNLLLKRPHFFAAALLMSGREAYSIEWIDGNATKENLAPLANTPIWFFHSKEDSVSPVKGSRINYDILHSQLNAPFVRYTEFSTEKVGDNGIINDNPHNTWDAVFNSPEAIYWLLRQKRHIN